jgi:hypothetical protein
MEAKVNARNDKSQYHLRMYCKNRATYQPTVPRSREKLTLGNYPSAQLRDANYQGVMFALPLFRDWVCFCLDSTRELGFSMV